MKTLELALKKKVLIVDAISQDIANGIIFQKFGVKTLSEFEFICKGSELTEEIASELVEKGKNSYGELKYENHYDEIGSFMGYDYALPSFISAVESKSFHWLKNPMSPYIPVIDKKADENYIKKYFESEEKTFRNPLIFVKK